MQWSTERRAVSALKDYGKNPRKFTEKGLADLKASMDRLGYIDPIAVNTDGTIIGGHARRVTLEALGLVEVDVRVPNRTLTEKEIQEAVVRLNKNIAGEWDFKVLEEAFDRVELIEWGFEKSEFNAFGSAGKTDPDETPPVPVTPVSILGDQWVLGDHVLRCGDSTDRASVVALLGGAVPGLMVTDPPYGVQYDASWRIGHDKNIGKGFTGGGNRALGKVQNDDRADWSDAWELFPGDVAYVWHGGVHTSLVADSLVKAKFKMRSQIIWVKQHFVFGRGDYHWKHEPCWYAVREGKNGSYFGDRKQTTVWEINNNNPFGNGGDSEEKTGHSTQKPVECMKRPIENNSVLGGGVYEPFCGSGTTIIAAEITGRRCYAMELDPVYVDMAIIRWENFTGKKAVHAVTGKPFNANTVMKGDTNGKGRAKAKTDTLKTA